MRTQLLVAALIWIFGITTLLTADGWDHQDVSKYEKEQRKIRKERYKDWRKQERERWKHIREQEREYRKHVLKQEREYRKQQQEHQREHRKWQQEQNRRYRKYLREWGDGGYPRAYPQPVYQHPSQVYPYYPPALPRHRRGRIYGHFGGYIGLDF